MKETMFILGALIAIMVAPELLAQIIPSWIMVALFVGAIFYGMFRLIRYTINANQ